VHLPQAARRLRLWPGQTISSLRTRNYRLYFFGQLVSVAGVMALWALAWLGTTPIGGPVVGWAGQAFGARWSLVLGGLPTVICGILALPALNRVDRAAGRVTRRPAAAGQVRPSTWWTSPQGTPSAAWWRRIDSSSGPSSRQ
jgi:hypothetical protein